MSDISAPGSLGVYAECPYCHAAIFHGFQVCQSCGHAVSAPQQAALQRRLLGNYGKALVIGVGLLITALVLANWLA